MNNAKKMQMKWMKTSKKIWKRGDGREKTRMKLDEKILINWMIFLEINKLMKRIFIKIKNYIKLDKLC
jgi:hypothetical protein